MDDDKYQSERPEKVRDERVVGKETAQQGSHVILALPTDAASAGDYGTHIIIRQPQNCPPSCSCPVRHRLTTKPHEAICMWWFANSSICRRKISAQDTRRACQVLRDGSSKLCENPQERRQSVFDSPNLLRHLPLQFRLK